ISYKRMVRLDLPPTDVSDESAPPCRACRRPGRAAQYPLRRFRRGHHPRGAMGRKASWAVVTAILLARAPAPSRGADAPEAITIRLVHPDRQLELLIDLFRGARAPHPAAALAAWRRATRDPVGLGKAAEAAIAVLNPEMVRELRTLD